MKKKSQSKHASLPKEHWEKSQPDLGGANLKYASEMGNPEDLTRSNEGLSGYVKKHKEKS